MWNESSILLVFLGCFSRYLKGFEKQQPAVVTCVGVTVASVRSSSSSTNCCGSMSVPLLHYSISLKWTVVHSLKDSLISSLYESLSLCFILPLSLSRLFNQSVGSLLSELLPPPGCIDVCASECFLSFCRPLLLCCAAIVRRLMRDEAAGSSDTGRGKLQINETVCTDRNMDSFFLSDL